MLLILLVLVFTIICVLTEGVGISGIGRFIESNEKIDGFDDNDEFGESVKNVRFSNSIL